MPSLGSHPRPPHPCSAPLSASYYQNPPWQQGRLGGGTWSSKHASLAHAPPQHLAQPVHLGNDVCRSRHYAANRSAQTLLTRHARIFGKSRGWFIHADSLVLVGIA